MVKKRIVREVVEEIDESAKFGTKAEKVHDKGDHKGEPAEGNTVTVLPKREDVLKRLEAVAGCGDPRKEAEARDMLVIARAAFGVE